MKIKQLFQLRLTNSELMNLMFIMFYFCVLFVYNPALYLATVIMITMSECFIMFMDYCINLGKMYMTLMQLEAKQRH